MGDNDTGAPAAAAAGHRRRRMAGAVVLALVIGLGGAACSDGSSDDEGSTTTVAGTDDGGSADGGGSGDDDVEVTSEEICAAVTIEVVAEATGLEVTGAVPSEGSTPQCAYSYPSENGPDSNLTVAASRYTSSDAQTIEEAFAGAVDLNSATAGADAEQTEVDAGDEAVLISGSVLTLGVLRVGDVLASLIVPPDTITPDRFEALMVATGDALA